MGDVVTQFVAVGALLTAIGGLLLLRRQGRNLDADTTLKSAQAEVALSADARAWVEAYADEARTAAAEARAATEEARIARAEAAACREEQRALRAALAEWEAWARRNARPDAEPMPRFTWPLPMPHIRPTDS